MPVASFAEAFSELKACIDPYVLSAQTVLEAGGGSLSHIELPAHAKVTVIDISPEQLQRNETAYCKVLGDLHTVDYGSVAFDLAVIWNVIEHLESPSLVLEKLHVSIRPGAIIVIAAPNPASLSGFITRCTPHWAHVFILRHVFNSKTAGLSGYPPFETIHHPDISLPNLHAWADSKGLEVLLSSTYESTRPAALREHSPILGFFWDLTIKVGNWITGAALDAGDYFFVVRRRP